MKTKILVILGIVAGLSARAGQAPDFSVSIAPAKNGVDLTITPPAHHHINVDAPMDAKDVAGGSSIKPSSAAKSKVRFHVTGQPAAEYVITAYLCDEKNTYCEKHEVHAKPGSTQVKPSPGAAKSEEAPTSKASPARPPKPAHALGFIVNEPEKALAEAARKKLPLLIDFYGIWCPPCNMLDEKVFSSPEFAKATSKFVKLKLDADAEVSWPLKSKYKVSGYPTVVFASADGDEIGRIVGFRPRADFLSDVRKAWGSRSEPYAKVKQKADLGDAEAAGRVGLIHLERREYEPALAYLAKSGKHPEELLTAEIGLLQGKADAGDAEAAKKLIETLEKSVKDFPTSFDSIERRQKLAELYEAGKEHEKHTAQLENAVRTATHFATHPTELQGHDAIPADLWETVAQAEEDLGHAPQAREAWSKGAAEYRKELAQLGKAGAGSERGFNLELVYCLWKSGDIAGAEKLYESLERRYPQEFTFYYSHARMSFELKKLDAALELAGKALLYSYGDNRLRAAQLLAKVDEALGRKKEGLAVVRQTLHDAALPDDQSIRTHRYVKQLKELEKKLSESL